MKSKKSGGYSPKYGEGSPSFGGPLMKVWKMVKKRLPFFARKVNATRPMEVS